MQTEIVIDFNKHTISFPGVDMGGKLTFLAVNPNSKLIAFKVGGHNYYGGQGQQRPYAPAKTVVITYERFDYDNVAHIGRYFSKDPANGAMSWGGR